VKALVLAGVLSCPLTFLLPALGQDDKAVEQKHLKVPRGTAVGRLH